jgi:cohesin complex subunit SCC1
MSETPLKDDFATRPGSPAASEEPSFGGGGGGDIDFDVDTSGQQFHVDVGVSLDTTTSSSPGRRRSNLGDLELSGLAEEEDKEDDDNYSNAKKRKPATAAGRKRMKKRRKIVIDNNHTELSSEHMKAMLRDTSDTMLQHVPHLAAWPRDDIDIEDDVDGYVGVCSALQKLPTERLLARPCIGDDGGLAPELLALWGRNMCKITGKAGTRLPFRMRGEGQRQGVVSEKLGEEEEEEEEDDEEVERVRSQQTRDSIDGHKLNTEDDDIEFGGRDEDIDFGNDDKQGDDYNADMETPFDIQDEFGTVEYKADDLAEDDEMSVRSDRSSFSLGAVNDLEKELYEIGDETATGEEGGAPRQLAGEELVSHNSKWHKHTVRVLGMLKRNLQSNDGDDDDDEPKELSYNKLIAGCSRRTAAGVFFEMLQLKTWDFVELEQNKSYGDITITPGVRFDEGPPSAVDG